MPTLKGPLRMMRYAGPFSLLLRGGSLCGDDYLWVKSAVPT